MMKFPEFAPLQRVYCWCVYYLYVQPFPGRGISEREFHLAVSSIMRYSVQEAYSPYELAVWKMITVLQRRHGDDAARLESYLSALKVDDLPAEPRSYARHSREYVWPSRREQWYSLMSRVLAKAGKYEECIAVCEEGMRIFPVLHGDNDIWFPYRIALCRLRLGFVHEAEREFTLLLRYKRHWVLYRGLFYCAKAGEDVVQMLRYGSAAMLCPGSMEEKVRLLAELGQVLSVRQEHQKEAFYHYALAVRIRRKNHWQISRALWNRVTAYSRTIPDWKRLQGELQEFWICRKHWGEEERRGAITSVLPGGSAGFVTAGDGVSFYFRKDDVLGGSVGVGQAVSFYVEEGQDGTRGGASKRAVDIRPAGSLF